jgi:hypothetical protein
MTEILEIVSPEQKPDPLATALVPELGADSALKIRSTFGVMFDEVDKWRAKVATVIVTREDQVAEMEIARTMRLALKKIRVNADHKRKELKAETDRYGKAVQSAFNLLEFQIVPLEKHLQDQEDFVERLKEKRIAETKEKRLAELAPFAIDTSFIDLGNMPEVSYIQFLATTRMAHEAKLAAAKKKAEDDLKELERQKKLQEDNDRLAREAADRQQKEKAEKERLDGLRLEREKQLLVFEENWPTVRQRFQCPLVDLAEVHEDNFIVMIQDCKRLYDAAAAERGRLVMEQEAERKRLKAAADAEKTKLEAQAKLAQEQADLERDKRLASEQEARDKKAQEDAKVAQEADAKRKADSAPDKEKMLAYADCLDHVYAPSVITETGKQLAASTLKALHDFTTKIRERANKFL